MKIMREKTGRRRFLGTLAITTATFRLGLPFACGSQSAPRTKTILSFYCDDTSPYAAGAEAFGAFLDFCAEQQIAGEASCILGMGGHSMVRHPDEQEQIFLRHVQRAWQSGIGTHMELMTHHGRFDFQGNRDPEGAVHEGLWLHEPEVSREQ